MKRLLVLVFLFFSLSAFGEVNALLTSVTGKVEVRTPGGDWEPAVVGMEIPRKGSISTGFKGEAVISIGASVLTIRRLTRLTLEELLENEETIKTDLYLGFGTVKGDIKSTSGLKNDYKLTSPVATAAVRGTIFTFDGVNLSVEEGTVVLFNKLNHKRSVGQGQAGSVNGYSIPVGHDESPLSGTETEEGGNGGEMPEIPVDYISRPPYQGQGSITINPLWIDYDDLGGENAVNPQ